MIGTARHAASRTAQKLALWSGIGLGLLAAGCAPQGTLGNAYGDLAAQSQARQARFQQISAANGLPPPSVTEVIAAGSGLPVTVVVFDEGALFASGSATPRPGSSPLFDTAASAIQQDVPGAQLTLLGHTDAVGSDALNDGLSLRRAQTGLGQLLRRSVDGAQLSTVAIGRRQPLAPNSTASGRARNRRVEFLVSNSQDANLAVIGNRPIVGAWLDTGQGVRVVPSSTVAVMQATGSASDVAEAKLSKSKELRLQPAQ